MIHHAPGDANWRAKSPRYRAAGLKTSFQVSRKRLEASRAALNASEHQLRAVSASATDDALITLDSQGQVTGWNTGAARILGWTEVSVPGVDDGVLYPVAEYEAGESTVELRDAVAHGRVESERWMLRRDGTRFWAAQTLTPLLGKDGEARGFLKILRDRTEQHQAETAVVRSEARLRRLSGTLDADAMQRRKERDRSWQLSQDLLMVAQANARLMAVNPAWSTVLGWAEHELVGQFALDLVHPDDQQTTFAELGRLAAGLPVHGFLNRYRHRDGSWRWFTWTAVLDGQLIYATGRDVTDEPAASRALPGAEAPMQQPQTLEAVGQLTGRIAHDFNNLLQGIGSNLDMLQLRLDQGRSAEAGHYVEAAHRVMDKAAALTIRLLASARRP
jgi:PAS domain S-box-containing protein